MLTSLKLPNACAAKAVRGVFKQSYEHLLLLDSPYILQIKPSHAFAFYLSSTI
jgi:hypothetical protein